MSDSPMEKFLVVFFRFTMGWTFLYAASHQVFVLVQRCGFPEPYEDIP
jgi:hypothetical protein